ncbi:MAG: group III truncated hemoglobin [Campylobacterota bacterium]|nr:group III truncated hemoglobin [Campylobacterota bacterium]
MRRFYEKAIEDKMLGPFFTNELGADINNEDWSEHINLLADFWLAQLLNEGPYWGNPSGAHFNVPHITRESFMKWIELFSATADEVYVPDVSARFKRQGVFLSDKFMRDLEI